MRAAAQDVRVHKHNGRRTQTLSRRCVKKKAPFYWLCSKCLVPAAVWSDSLRGHWLEMLFGCGGEGRRPQTTNMHQPKQDLFFFGTVEQQVVVTCSWPAVRVKSSKWSSATRWQQNGPLIRIKQSHVRLIGPCRIFSPPLLLNSKHQAAARKSSRLSLLRLEAKCFTV